MKKFLLIPAFAVGLMLAGCPAPSAQPVTPVKQSQEQKAARAANSIQFNENAEIDNIKNRLELTSKVGLLGYVALVNRVGQVVMYTPVRGKITSGSKRLTSPDKRVPCDKGEWNGDCFIQAPSDEGTFGHSNPYVFFWTTQGQYIQTSMDYVYSDVPLVLAEKPLLMLPQPTDTTSSVPASPPK